VVPDLSDDLMGCLDFASIIHFLVQKIKEGHKRKTDRRE
jgi:hypothetical protein